MNNDKRWFKSKRYGYGWTPASKEGWIATILFSFFIAIVTISFRRLAEDLSDSNSDNLIFLLILYFSAVLSSLTAFLLLVTSKGEKPRWNWGQKNDK